MRKIRILDLLFPRRCVLCDGALSKDEENICKECAPKVGLIGGDVCMVCGRSVQKEQELCPDCTGNKHRFRGGRFALSYDVIGDSVFKFKYSNRPEYAKFYAKSITDRWGEWIEAVNADALVPVPLHKKRLLKRGYNQAELLSKELSRLTGIPSLGDYATRVKNTAPQKKYDRKQRQINVEKAFIVNKNSVKLKTVIVVDDIFTTGSTIDSLSEALMEAGVKRVYFLTITAAGT